MAEPFLEGVRVLDMTRLLPGPYATSMLADMGADVVKVEEPTTGDPVRERDPKADDRSYTTLIRNRSKRSVAIDLKADAGRQAFLDLAADADVVFESFRPGVVDRLGVGYDDVTAVNEDVVYCSLTGYGQTGPYADHPGHDINYVGVAGLLSVTGDSDGPPTVPGFPVSDFAGGMYAALAILGALVGRGLGRGGEYLDVSMTDVVATFMTAQADRFDAEGVVPERGTNWLTGGHPGYRVYEAGDGEYLTVGALEKKFWDGFCETLGEPELKAEHVGPNEPLGAAEREAFVERFQARLRERPREAWLGALRANDVPAAPVNDYAAVFDDPQLGARDLFDAVTLTDGREVLQVGSPVRTRNERLVAPEPVSRLGADTAALLQDVGYDDARIRELADAGAVRLGE